MTPTTFADGGLGSGSLRDAVLQFNADTGTDDDIIQLLPGTYSLTIRNTGGHENEGLQGDLDLNQTSHRWIIHGAGPSTIIDASQLQDRVFQIVNPGTQVLFQDLVIQGGLAQDNGTEHALPGTTDALGGGIFNNGGNVTLDNVVLQNNVARGGDAPYYPYGEAGQNARGGGLYSTGGALSISDSTLTPNEAMGGRGGPGGVRTFGSEFQYISPGAGGSVQGGGLYSTGGALTISDSSVANNQAVGGVGGTGGGYEGSAPGGNAQGGGLYAAGGLLTFSDSAATANTLRGGDGNRGASDGGACQGGGLYVGSTVLTVRNATIAGNTLRGGDGGSSSGVGGDGGTSQGSGLYAGGGMLTITNSTIAANTLGGGTGGNGFGFYYYGTGGSGGVAEGAGLWVAAGATAQVSFDTISNNQATGGTHGNGNYNGRDGAATGGGLYNQGTLQSYDTILADNTVAGPGATSSPDLFGDLGSVGYNLIGNFQGGTGFEPTDLLNVDPQLGPLQDNGGPTQTMALLPGSPAIDAGDPNFVGPPFWDQRGDGFPRISGGAVDIGAFEVQQGQIPSFSVTNFPSPVTAGQDATFTVTALDADGNLNPTYTGTVHFTSTDPQALLPHDYTFTANDQGVHTFDATLRTAGTQALFVRDTVARFQSGYEAGIVVLPAAADHYTLSGPAIVAGDSAFVVTLTARDAFGNQATSYQGTVHFNSTDPQATLPDDYTFTAADGGSHRFRVTLHSAGQQTLTVQDTVNGSLSIDHDVHVSRTFWLATSFRNNNAVLRYDGDTGTFIDILVAPGAGGLDGPVAAVIGPDGNVYVSSYRSNQVLRYDRNTGAFLGVFVTAGSGGLTNPDGLLFHDGDL
jgi:hypothetical protein